MEAIRTQSSFCGRYDARRDNVKGTFAEGQWDMAPSAMLPLWLLRVLHDESKHAGRRDLSEYYSRLEEKILDRTMYGGLLPEVFVAELVRIAKVRAAAMSHGRTTPSARSVSWTAWPGLGAGRYRVRAVIAMRSNLAPETSPP